MSAGKNNSQKKQAKITIDSGRKEDQSPVYKMNMCSPLSDIDGTKYGTIMLEKIIFLIFKFYKESYPILC